MAAAQRVDPENRLLWKHAVGRLDAGEIRDAMLASSGELSRMMGGPSGLSNQSRRTIDTRYFDNPLSAINAHPVGAARASKAGPAHASGIEVRLTFKNPKDAHEAQVRTATESDGMFYTYLTFAEGADAAANAPPATDAPATLANPEQ